MPNFVYKAKRGPGDFVEGQMRAETQEEVIAKLDSLNLIPIKIEQSKTVAEKPSRAVSASGFIKVKSKMVDAFTWQLASLVRANVPLLRSLSLIAQQITPFMK